MMAWQDVCDRPEDVTREDAKRVANRLRRASETTRKMVSFAGENRGVFKRKSRSDVLLGRAFRDMEKGADLIDEVASMIEPREHRR